MSDVQPGAAADCSTAASCGFRAVWCAMGLHEYRPCRYTYEDYPYESLPPLDPARFTGDFGWLGGVGDPVPEQVAKLDRLAADLAAHDLTLPQDFRTFQAGARRREAFDEVSATACYSHLCGPLSSPVEPGAFLVRFLRDQQDCVLWYLYLRPCGEAFVVCSEVDYEWAYEQRSAGRPTETDLDDMTEQRAAIRWCAASFEEFAYRFWVENRLWFAIRDGVVSQLESPLRDYLRHYERA